MKTLLVIVAVIVGGFFLLSITMNVVLRRKAKALEGQPVPDVPGPIGATLHKAGRSLVYFFSPQCGACRTITPKMRALSEHNERVFVVDVTQHLDVARALRVLATPSTVEVADGRIVGVHMGPLPSEVEARFSP